MVSWRLVGIGIYAIGLLVAGVYGVVAMTSFQAQVAATNCTDIGLASGTLPSCLPSETIAETGSALMWPLMNLWIHNTKPGHTISDFNTLYPNVAINTVNSGSGVGQLYVEQKLVQLGASSAFLTDQSQSRYPNVLNIAVGVTAVIINYNLPDFPLSVHLNFTAPLLARIYNGTVASWDNPEIKRINPGAIDLLPSQPIKPIHRTDASGDTLHFTEYLSRTDLWWNRNYGTGLTIRWPDFPNAQAIIGNPGIVIECHALPYSISYVSVEALDLATSFHLGAGYVQNYEQNNFLSYSASNIEAGLEPAFSHIPADERVSLTNSRGPNAYPMVSFAYLLVWKNQPNSDLALTLRTFLRYAIFPQYGNSQVVLDQYHFLPLPSSVAQLSLAQVDQIQ